jgi:hypothetical protein
METVSYKNHTIKILPDDSPLNPRDDDNIGTMICFHPRYTLGDKHDFKHGDYSTEDELLEAIAEKYGKNPVLLPLYLYDHSCITISTSPVSCPWDSGKIGYIVCSREKAIKEYGKKIFTPKIKRLIIANLLAEVKTYDLYLTGGFVGYTITDKSGELTDSCWGFDDADYALSQAKSVVDYAEKIALQKRSQKLKTLIKNHVSINHRQTILT